MKAITFIAIGLFYFILLNEISAQEIIKVNLADSVNTSYTETKPMISPDGETLYFARQNYPENINGKDDDQDIYQSNYAYNGWNKAVNIGKPLNNNMPNGVVSIAQNGQTLLLLNAYDNSKQEGVAISHKIDSGWSTPTALEIRDFHNHSEFVDYFLSANNQEMLIAVERDDSFGDQDLYVSKKESDGKWSKPINLGDIINTKKAEFSPFLAADNRTLFFASFGHDGMGDADIYYTKRLDSTWTNWSVPENLGPDVNTSGFEAYYTIPNNGTIGFYVSSEGGKDNSRDIFSITLPYKFRPEPVILLKGALLHADNTIDTSEFRVNFLTDMASESEIFIDYNGTTFDALLPTGGSYFFYTSKSGFISESHYIDLSKQKEYAEEVANIHTIPIKKGSSFSSHNLQFDNKTANLASSSFFELIRLLEIFQRNEGLQVEIKGHAFDFQEGVLNDSISLERVKYIKNFYVEQGLNEGKFILKADGSNSPSNDSYKRHLNSNFNENNRIEFTILNTDFKPQEQADKTVAFSESKSTNQARLKPAKIKTNYTIQFEFGSDNWTTNKEELNSLDSLMARKILSDAQFEIVGYTCNMGDSLYNQYLSGLRAESVKKWLLNAGIAEENISTEYGGNTNPVATNATMEGRKKNRRVALTIVLKQEEALQYSSN